MTSPAFKLKASVGIPDILWLFDVIKMDSDFPPVHKNHTIALLMATIKPPKTAEKYEDNSFVSTEKYLKVYKFNSGSL